MVYYLLGTLIFLLLPTCALGWFLLVIPALRYKKGRNLIFHYAIIWRAMHSPDKLLTETTYWIKKLHTDNSDM